MAMNRAFLVGMAVLLLSSEAANAQTINWQNSWDETLAAARKEGKVVVAGPPDTQVRQLLPAAFEARYGIKMEIHPTNVQYGPRSLHGQHQRSEGRGDPQIQRFA